jgi:hypothetical protein
MNGETLTAKYTLLRLLQFALLEIRHDAGQAGTGKKCSMLADLFHNVPLALAQERPDYAQLLADLTARATHTPQLARWVAANTPRPRMLPAQILGEEMNPASLEAQEVVAKFGKPDAKFGESNIDTVALIYMSAPAIAYWLPAYFAYLRQEAPHDSFHFESILFKLRDPAWAARMREELDAHELVMVQDFVRWLALDHGAGDTVRAEQYAEASILWGIGEDIMRQEVSDGKNDE